MQIRNNHMYWDEKLRNWFGLNTTTKRAKKGERLNIKLEEPVAGRVAWLNYELTTIPESLTFNLDNPPDVLYVFSVKTEDLTTPTTIGRLMEDLHYCEVPLDMVLQNKFWDTIPMNPKEVKDANSLGFNLVDWAMWDDLDSVLQYSLPYFPSLIDLRRQTDAYQDTPRGEDDDDDDDNYYVPGLMWPE